MTSRSKSLPWAAIIIAPGREARTRTGCWSAYVAPTRDAAIQKAIEVRNGFDPTGARYDILVGRIEAKAVVPLNFELAPLDGGEVIS